MSNEQGMPGPSAGTLRAASAGLMVQDFSEKFHQQIKAAVQAERFYQGAEAVGVPRAIAHELLQRAQGRHVGSTPTAADLEAARELVLQHALSGPVSMTDQLRDTVQHLATTTAYSPAELIAAVETLRGLRDPWPDGRISDVLPMVTEMAESSPCRLADLAQTVRQACV